MHKIGYPSVFDNLKRTLAFKNCTSEKFSKISRNFQFKTGIYRVTEQGKKTFKSKKKQFFKTCYQKFWKKLLPSVLELISIKGSYLSQ